MKIEEAKIGTKVVYKPWPDAPGNLWELGTISDVNKDYIFVKFNPSATYGSPCPPSAIFSIEKEPTMQASQDAGPTEVKTLAGNLDPMKYVGLIRLSKLFQETAFHGQSLPNKHPDDVGPLYIKMALVFLTNKELRDEVIQILNK